MDFFLQPTEKKERKKIKQTEKRTSYDFSKPISLSVAIVHKGGSSPSRTIHRGIRV